MTGTGRRVAGAAGLVLMLLFLSVAFTPLPNVLALSLTVPARIGPAEAIVVLGGGTEDSQTPSPGSIRRTIHAMRLYRQGLAPTIIFSGGKAGDEVAEGTVMASFATEFGVPSGRIWVETQSNDTWTEALEVARLAQPKGVRRILLVTDPLHIRRASWAFERVGFEVLPAAWEKPIWAHNPEGRLVLMRMICLEQAARLYYWVRGRV